MTRLAGYESGASPLAFQTQILNIDPQLGQTLATAQAPGEDYFATMLRVANSYILADSQRRLLNVQIERAKAGQPPLDSSQYGLGVSLGLSPQVQQALFVGGAALLVAVLFLARKGR